MRRSSSSRKEKGEVQENWCANHTVIIVQCESVIDYPLRQYGTMFDHFGTMFDHCGTIVDNCGTIVDLFGDHFGPCLDHVWTIL